SPPPGAAWGCSEAPLNKPALAVSVAFRKESAMVHRGRQLLLAALGRAEQGDWAGAASGIAAARAAGTDLGAAGVAAALVFLQAGRRGDAIGAFEEARRRDPAD